jgi:hypothetical protein
MGNLANTIPFTELWERLLTMGRIDSPNNVDYAKGIINDVYVRTLPRIADWNPIIVESNLSMSASYNTGSATITAGSTSVTGTGTVWTTAMLAVDGYKISFAGNDNIYSFTRLTNTTGTISPALSGDQSLTNVNYTIYRDEYQLAADFDRLLRNGSIYVYSGGRVSDIIEEVPRDEFREDFSPEATDPLRRVMLSGTHSTTGYRLIRVNPPPLTAKVYPYEYVKKITPMTEYSTGTVTATNASTTITGSGTTWTSGMVGQYFRVDSNGLGDSSKWYRIAAYVSGTQLTLETAYEEATESALEYHISSSPTAFPSEFHEFILYEGLTLVMGEQTDPTIENVQAQKTFILSDLKKNYKNRRTNVQFSADDDGYRSWQ